MRNSMIRAVLGTLALGSGIIACNPGIVGDDGGPPAEDVAWIVDGFARGGDCEEDHITLCLAGYYYEYEFRSDGTLQAYEVVCGVRQAADPSNQGRWRATHEYGVVDVLPPEGAESFKLPGANVEHGSATLTDDCQVVELKHNAEDPQGVSIYRGEFRYEPSGCGARAFYLGDGEPPECPETLP